MDDSMKIIKKHKGIKILMTVIAVMNCWVNRGSKHCREAIGRGCVCRECEEFGEGCL